MENINTQYHDLLTNILSDGVWRIDPNRKGVLRKQLPFYSITVDLRDGFPAINTKPLYWKGVVCELLWMLRGHTAAQMLSEYGVHIWDADADRWGSTDLGRIYGYQWRRWGASSSHDAVDQIHRLIDNLLTNPMSSEMVVTAWNPNDIDFAAVPPCHWSFQVTCEPIPLHTRLAQWQAGIADGDFRNDNPSLDDLLACDTNAYYLDLSFNMRSSDVLLGLPFNIASYALLMHILGKIAGMTPRYLRYNGVNVHLYENQIDAATAQLDRDPNYFPLAELYINEAYKDKMRWADIVTDVKWTDFELKGYKSCVPLPKVDMLTYDSDNVE